MSSNIPVAAFRFGVESQQAFADVKKMRGALGDTEKSARGLSLSLGKLAGALSAGAFTAFVHHAAQTADELGKAADRIGTTTESLTVMRTVAKESGIALQTLDESLTDANRRLGDAVRGTGEARVVLQGLGLDVNKLATLSPDELFRTYAEAIGSLRTRAEQASAAQALFGRGAIDLMPIITDGGAAIASAAEFVDRFGLSLSRLEIKQIEGANDALERVGQVAQVSGQRIAVGLSPLIEHVANTMLDASANTRDLQGYVEGFSAVAITAFEVAGNAARSLQAAFFGLAAGGARVLQMLTLGDVSDSFAASVDANLAKAQNALQAIKSIDQIQQTVIDVLSRSRENAAAALGPGSIGDVSLGTASFDIAAPDGLAAIQEQLRAEQELRNHALTERLRSENEAMLQLEAANRGFIERRIQMQTEAQDLYNRVTQGGVLFEIRLHELKNQTLLQSGASLVGAILTSNKKLAKAKQAFELAQAIWATARGVTQAFPNFPLMAAVAAAGALQIAKIRATQYFEGGVGGGGGFSPGLQTAPVPASNSNAPPAPTQDAQSAIEIHVHGDIMSGKETAQYFIDTLRDAFDRDVVIIKSTSAQAAELLPT